MKEHIDKILSQIQNIRHHIHAHPELRYEEHQTAALIIEQLQKLGLEVQAGIGKTGVIAIIDSGKPGKTVALRADMDALPLQEETQLPYCSMHKGKMHACGHDGHVASLLGAAHVLCQMRDKFQGKIKLIFQPAEEGGAGAAAMIADGVLQNPNVDAIFAYHNHPGYPIGQILSKSDCIFYGNTEFSIVIRGVGGHAAHPELAINPITITSLIIQEFQKLTDQWLNDKDPSVISITQMKGGTATNIIPEQAFVSGTIRFHAFERTKQIQHQLGEAISAIARISNTTIDISFQEIYPPTINTLDETDFALAVARDHFGHHHVVVKPASSRASEDFSYFLQNVPGCYLLIGNGENTPFCHSPHYDYNDKILPTAIALLSQLAIRYLNEHD